MFSLVTLKRQAIFDLNFVINELGKYKDVNLSVDLSIRRANEIISDLNAINLTAYFHARRQGGSTNEIFEQHLERAISRFKNDLFCLFGQIRETTEYASINNMDLLIANGIARKHAKRALSCTLRMNNFWLRLIGSWIIPVVLLFVAIMYALYFFIYKYAGLNLDISNGTQAVAKANSGILDFAILLKQAPVSLDALKETLKKATELFSTIPPFIASIAVVYASIKKYIV